MIAVLSPGVADPMPESQPVSVRVRDLARRYGPIEALKGVSFDVAPGEVFGLLGPNGAGKTTALECILGLRRPDSGAITIAGIDALARPQEAKQLLGAQIQAATLQDKITPRRALGLFASFYRRHADVAELIGRFRLAEKADEPFDSLSGGQRQRLFLAIAFVNNPGLVVLDEPTAGLDPLSRRELHGIISEMRDAGRTVLLSTHDLGEAQVLCDRIGILDHGSLVAAGSPAELTQACGTPSSVQVRAKGPLDGARIGALAGVTAARREGDLWVLGTGDVNATVVGLVGLLEADGNEILELRIARPSLEDVFLSVTGRPWGDPREEAR